MTASPRVWGRKLALSVALLLTGGALSLAAAVDQREYALKAAFLYHFTQFIEWPPEAIPPPGDPIRIGILHPNPFGTTFEKMVRGQSIDGRPIEVVYLNRIMESESLQILFIPQGASAATPRALAHLAGQPVLLVGENLEFLRAGGMISLVREQDRVLIYINRRSLMEGGLSASARLLRLATTTENLPDQ